MLLARLRGYFIPTPTAITMIWIAGSWLGITFTLFAVTGVMTGDLGAGMVLWGVVGPPVAGIFLAVGAFKEPRSGPRALILAVMNLLVPLVALSSIVPVGQVSEEAKNGLILLFNCCSWPVMLPLVGLTLFFGFRAWPELRQILRAARYHRVNELLQARGDASFGEIGAEVGLPEAQAGQLVSELVTSGELMAYLDMPHCRAYSTAALAARQHRMAAILRARGQLSLDGLAGELGVPVALLNNWLRQLVQRGQFSGYVDWEQKMLFSVEAGEIENQGRCPHCGGEVNLAGQGVIQCSHCSVEVFL